MVQLDLIRPDRGPWLAPIRAGLRCGGPRRGNGDSHDDREPDPPDTPDTPDTPPANEPPDPWIHVPGYIVPDRS